MNKSIAITFAIILILTSSTFFNIVEGSSIEEVTNLNHYGKGFRYNIQGWMYIHLEGSPYERGYQYGYLATDEIVDTLYRWGKIGHTEDFMEIFIIKQQPQNYDKLSK